MAESIVKIKLAVDTASTAKLEDTIRSLSAQEKKANEASSFYRENQKAALVRLKDVASGLSTILKKQEEQFTAVGNSIASLKLKEVFNAQILKDFNASLSSTIAEFSRLSNIISTAPAAAGTISRTPLTDLSQVSTENLRAYYQNLEKLDREANAEKIRTAKEYNDFVAQYERARVERITSETKRMYAAMFDEIAAKEVAAQERAARINAARKTADSRGYTPFALGTVGQVREAEQAKIDAARKTADDRGYTPFSAGTVAENRALKDQERANALTAKQEAAMVKLQSLQKEYAKDQSEILKNQEKHIANTNKVTEAHKPWGKSLESLIIQYRAINFAYNQFLNTLYNIPKVGIQLESTVASLTATFGSAVAAQREIQFLTQEAVRTGVTVGTLREQYANAAASFIAAGESADTTRRIFQNVNTVATTLHLSSDRVSSVYLALSQIFNKTKLQAEELTKQLSQTIPGVTNQQAKALGITVSELYDKMKKGAISAHEAVLALSETLGQTFGGDAFTAAAQGLNAEVGRLNTSWTLLSENLYKGSEEGLKSTVKFFDSLVRSLVGVTSNTEKTKETFSALTSIISGLLVGSILTGAKAFVDLTVKGEAATTMVGRLVVSIKEFAVIMVKNPFILMATALATVASNLYLVKERQDQLNDSVRTHLGLTLAEQKSAGYSVQQTDTFQKNTELIKQTEEEILRLTKRAETIKNLNSVGNIIDENEKRATDEALTNANRNYILLKEYRKKLIADFYKEPESQVTKNIFDASEARAKFEIAADKAAGDKVLSARKQFILSNAKELAEVQQQLDDAIKAGNQEKIDSALKGLQDYQSALNKAGIKDTSAKAATQAYRTDIEETKAAFEQFKTDIASTLGVLDNLYQENQLSIEEYFTRKLALQKDDIAVQRQMLEAERAIAIARGDSTKAAKLEYEIRKLNTQGTKEEFENQKDLTKALQDYKSKIEEIRAAELTAQGKGGEGLVEKFKIQYADVYTQATKDNDVENLKLLKNRELTLKLTGELNTLDAERQLAQQKYNLELDKVNTKVSAGIMGQFQAMSELTKANEDYLKVKEAEYSKMLQFIREVEAGKGEVPAKDRLEAEQMNNEIEKMKLNANEFANYFQKTVGDGFANAFTEFARGTKTAKEAFRDMAASIAQDLAKLAAQEAASSLMSGILKPLFSAALSGIGGLFSSGTSVAAGNSAAWASTMSNNTNWMTAKYANGGVASGLSSVSGSMLTSATYFPNARVTPLASGGVVAGEAGAEAVLPLKRNKAGKLGVVLENSGQSAGNVYNISVNVQSSANDTPAGTGEKIAVSIMRTIAREEISSARRSGNFKAARSM